MLLCYQFIISKFCLTEVDVHLGVFFSSLAPTCPFCLSLSSRCSRHGKIAYRIAAQLFLFTKNLSGFILISKALHKPWRFSRCFMSVTVLPALGTEQFKNGNLCSQPSVDGNPSSLINHQFTVVGPFTGLILFLRVV